MGNTVITIARSYGSGGRTLGKLLAKELGINYYDRELIRMASDESGINEALFGEVDEKLKKSPLFRIVKKTYRGEIIPPESGEFVSDDNLFNYQAKVIRQLAEESANSAVESKKLIEQSLSEVDDGNKVTKETGEAMKKVMDELDKIIQEVANIRTASDRQATSVEEIRKGVEDINDVIQSNSAAAEETSATSEELAASASTLSELLEKFVLRD